MDPLRPSSHQRVRKKTLGWFDAFGRFLGIGAFLAIRDSDLQTQTAELRTQVAELHEFHGFP